MEPDLSTSVLRAGCPPAVVPSSRGDMALVASQGSSPSPAPATSLPAPDSCWSEAHPPPQSPHLVDAASACDGVVRADGERGNGVHHQGQQDHEQDVGICQGVLAGICGQWSSSGGGEERENNGEGTGPHPQRC